MTSAPPDPPPGLPLRAADPAQLFDLLGGSDTFGHLVSVFYAGVQEDTVLRPLYPDDDFAAAEQRLRMFLEQYWGGPRTYSDQRGHPRLRMRHAPFRIGVAERDAWLARMRVALDAVDLPPAADQTVWTYFVSAADSMRNVVD